LVYLSLGSNIGKRLRNLQTAIKRLREIGFDIIKSSAIYKTDAWGVTDQPNFLNLILKGKTKLSPKELLKEIKRIEKEIGRKPTKKWGPRVIDIDILFYDKKVFKSNVLTIPHPQLHKRAFVLIPLKEIAPRLIHPLIKKTVSQMLNNLNDNNSVVLYNKSAKEKILL